jgi:hypothetical protein
MGAVSPIDDSASATNTSAGNGEAPSGPSALDSKLPDAPTTTNATKDEAAVGTEQQPETTGGDVVSTLGITRTLGEELTGAGTPDNYEQQDTARCTAERDKRTHGEWRCERTLGRRIAGGGRRRQRRIRYRYQSPRQR